MYTRIYTYVCVSNHKVPSIMLSNAISIDLYNVCACQHDDFLPFINFQVKVTQPATLIAQDRNLVACFKSAKDTQHAKVGKADWEQLASSKGVKHTQRIRSENSMKQFTIATKNNKTSN